jgi:outer membrane protein assembly factor BamB
VRHLQMPAAIPTMLAAGLLVVLTCKEQPVGHPPASPREPKGISSGGYNSPYEFTATTTDPDTDSVAIHFSWGDGTSSEWSAWIASGETVTLSHSWSTPGTYQVKAQAKDKPGSTSGWSFAHLLTIISTRAPDAPGAPTGPSSTRKNSLCDFTAIASDPDDDGVSYRFDWGMGDTSAWSDWVPSGKPVTMRHAFRRAGTPAVRAQARDINEAMSAWSTPLSVTIPNPHAPQIYDMESRCGAVAGDTLDVRTSSLDQDQDSVAMRIAWGDGDTSDWSGLVRPGDPVKLRHAWSDSGAYAVGAQAMDEDGAVSAWAEGCSVHVWRPRWRHQAGSGIESSPAVAADGTVYFGSDDRCMYAVDPNGTLKWRYQTGGTAAESCSSPAVAADGTVYFGTFDGYLYALDPAGALKWRYQTGYGVLSSPAVAADGTVYFGSGDSFLYAVDASGALKWRYLTTGGVYSSPAVAADGTVYFGSDDHYMHAIDPNGTLKWRYRTGHAVRSSPAVATDGTVYFGSGDEYLYALDPAGALKWRYLAGGSVYSSPAVAADGTVYFGSNDRYMYAIDPNGALKWRYQTGDTVLSSPAVAADGTVHFGSGDGCLYVISPIGALKRRYATCRYGGVISSPAIADDGTVYVGSDAHYLYAIEGDSPLADSPWPKFHHDNRNTGRAGAR